MLWDTVVKFFYIPDTLGIWISESGPWTQQQQYHQGDRIEMQALEAHPRSTDSEILGMGPGRL